MEQELAQFTAIYAQIVAYLVEYSFQIFGAVDAAVSMRSPRIVRLLIDYGADINMIDSDGDTPLHRAASQGSLEIVKALLNAGADVDVKNDMGLKAASVAKIAELSSLDENFDIIVQLLKSSEEG